MFKKPFLKYGLPGATIVVISLGIFREISMSQIPDGQKSIPYRMVKEEIPVPKRPGTKSIRIIGPPLKVLKFQLDFKRHPLPLDWDYLERIDKRADISVTASIGVNGNIFINKMLDRGHPKAGEYIKEVLKSWHYLQYKTGTIKFYFNVPTRDERRKVIVDLRGLKKNPRFVGYRDLLKNGLVYFIEGIARNNITLIN